MKKVQITGWIIAERHETIYLKCSDEYDSQGRTFEVWTEKTEDLVKKPGYKSLYVQYEFAGDIGYYAESCGRAIVFDELRQQTPEKP